MGTASLVVDPEVLSALWLSSTVAFWAATIGLPLAAAVAYLLARGRFAGKWLVETLVYLPLVLPPVVTGYLLLVLFAPGGPLGGLLDRWFGVKIVFTWYAAVLAAAVVGFPLLVRAVRLAFEQVDPRLELAARSLGAGRMRTFFTVTLPLAQRGLVAGWMLAFARSLGEFGATIMIAGNIAGQTRTIPLAVYSLANRPGGTSRCWPLIVVSVILACAAIATSEWLARRQPGNEHP